MHLFFISALEKEVYEAQDLDYAEALRALLVSSKFCFQAICANKPYSRVLYEKSQHPAWTPNIFFCLVYSWLRFSFIRFNTSL